MAFPDVIPGAPWEASALLSNTSIAAGLPNAARLDRLTHLEAVVANLMLAAPPTLGTASMPFTRHTTARPSLRPGNVAAAGDFTGAQVVTFAYQLDDDAPRPPTLALTTRAADVMIDDMPHVRPGDAWLVLIENEAPVPFRLRGGHNVERPDGGGSDQPLFTVPANRSLLVLVSVPTLTRVVVRRLLLGRSQADEAAL